MALIPLPALNANSILGYIGLAAGLAVGFALWVPVGEKVESKLSR